MQYINITNGKAVIAEVCGNVVIYGNNSTFISVCPEDKIKALKLVLQVKDASFHNDSLTIPTGCISYMSNNTKAEKPSIKLIEPEEPEEL